MRPPFVTRRTALEISALMYRLVQTDAPAPGRSQEVGLRSYAAIARSSPAAPGLIASLRDRDVHAIVWGVPSDHRRAMVVEGSAEAMRAEAVAAFVAAGGDLGQDVRRVLADVIRIGPDAEPGTVRPVLLAIADVDAVRTALTPLTDAGVRIASVVTPALALFSLARLRQQPQDPSSTEAYVALGEKAICIAAVRGGVLLAARELSWGFLNDGSADGSLAEITLRLGDELARFFVATPTVKVTQICVCGGLPHLRAMTAALMERFDVEVEPLDSMFGIDQTSMPEPAGQFRERVAEMRLAWAIAADGDCPLNLFQVPRARAKTIGAPPVAANLATGVGAPELLGRTAWWRRLGVSSKLGTRPSIGSYPTKEPWPSSKPSISGKPT